MVPVKLRWLLALAALAAIAASAAVAATLRADGSARPSVSLASEQPLIVSGRDFKAGEQVTVVASVNGRQFRRLMAASARGRFSARFGAVDASCGMLYVAVTGQKGSRAAVRRRGVPAPCGISPGADLNG
jgi:hypothetical protein